MKTISMLELRSNGREVVRRLERGERLELTYRGRKVVRRVPRLVRVLFDALDRSVSIRRQTVGEDRFQEARSLLLKYEEHALPLTDCTSIVVMREMGLQDALTADRHFRTMGFNPLLAD